MSAKYTSWEFQVERFEGIYKKSSLPNKVVVQYVLSVVTHYGHVTGNNILYLPSTGTMGCKLKYPDISQFSE